jgi:hypothetical protein
MEEQIKSRIEKLADSNLIVMVAILKHRTACLHPRNPAVFYIGYLLKEQIKQRGTKMPEEKVMLQHAVDAFHVRLDVPDYLGMKSWRELFDYYNSAAISRRN